ncbi:VOC family protein [Luteolibacter sp. Populi]|uniref:VOC family protein n=1 Tax=Luteolibacter sp. Populi TaxID=3230487 RepID=UPI00346702DC
MSRIFDHIDLRVPDLAAAEGFYRQLLPALGFTREMDIEGWLQFESESGDRFFGVTESPGHRANENRIAFHAKSAGEVDRLAGVAKAAGAREIEGPMDYEEAYYAVFFEDPCGNRFEVACRR